MKIKPNQCPRCGGMIPDNLTPGKFPGAMSRVDNETEVCSRCGVDEAREWPHLRVAFFPVNPSARRSTR